MDGIGKRNGTTATTERSAFLLLAKPSAVTTKSTAAKNSIVLPVPKVGMKTRIRQKCAHDAPDGGDPEDAPGRVTHVAALSNDP